MDLGLHLQMANAEIAKIYLVKAFLVSQLFNKLYKLCKSYSIVCFCGVRGMTVKKMNLDVKGFGRRVSYVMPLWLCDTGDGEGKHES